MCNFTRRAWCRTGEVYIHPLFNALVALVEKTEHKSKSEKKGTAQ